MKAILAPKKAEPKRAKSDERDLYLLNRKIKATLGQEPDPDDVERILSETGKTLDDLQRAVELYLKRRALKATVDQKAKLEKDRQQIEKQISQAGESLTAAEKKYKETTDPLLGQRDYIRDQMLEIERAKTELERTCDDQDLLDELAKAERQLNVLHTRRKRSRVRPLRTQETLL